MAARALDAGACSPRSSASSNRQRGEEFDPLVDANEEASQRPRILLGSARSGTTWVQDVLAAANGRRTIFEPLHPEGDPRAQPFAHAFLESRDDAPELAAFLREAILGRSMRLWWDLRVNPAHVFRWQSPIQYTAQAYYIYQGLGRFRKERGKPTITKMIRGNLMGGWLVTQLNARVAHVLRHPCAVVASQLRVDPAAWHDHHELLARYLADERLASGPLADHRAALVQLSDPTDVHAALWCIENVIPLRRAPSDGVAIVHYEHLLAHDGGEWRVLLDALDLDHAPDQNLTSRPSQQAASDMKNESFDIDTMGRWRERLASDQIDRIRRMLDRFEVDVYSCDSPIPVEIEATPL